MSDDKVHIAVIGTGYVGLVSGVCLAKIGHQVICIDIDAEKIDNLNAGNIPIFEPGLSEAMAGTREAGNLKFTTSIAGGISGSEAIFICVGTPPRDDGSADLRALKEVAREIAAHADSSKLVINKSTVPVETAQAMEAIFSRALKSSGKSNIRFEIASNPETLREGCAIQDFMDPDRIIVGVRSEIAERVMRKIYAPWEEKIVVMSPEAAELTKHASNMFLANKLSFVFALSQLCQQVGADVTEVIRGMGLDRRIGPSFLQPTLGFGGSCFPKDAAALGHIFSLHGITPHLVEATMRINHEQTDRFIETIIRALHGGEGELIAVWGAAFKANTDDIRESPALKVVERLCQQGARVILHDPEALSNAKKHFAELGIDEQITFADSMWAITGASALVITAPWGCYREANLQKLSTMLPHPPIVIDGHNLFDLAEMRRRGFIYHSIGRPTVAPNQNARA